ncbi:hypothetical protein EON65_27900 [archaeon]|nr:MAG: hypothetical protein EON65_27900 [archaeon]
MYSHRHRPYLTPQTQNTLASSPPSRTVNRRRSTLYQ